MDKNGVSLGQTGNEDIDSLKVYVANTIPVPVSVENVDAIAKAFEDVIGLALSKTEATSSSTTIDLTPKPSDFQNMKGNLAVIVPSGFLMIHNDLEALIEALGEKEKSSSTSSSSLLSGASSLLGGGLKGLAVSAGVGIGAGAISGIANLFDNTGNKEAEDHLKSIINELNMELTADDFREDPEVKQAQHDSFVTYLSTYYTQQAAATVTEGVLGAIGTGVADAVVNLFNGLFRPDKVEEDPVRAKLDSIVLAITEQMTAEDYVGDSDILDTQKSFVKAYLWTYYSTQIAGMTVENIAGSLGSAVGNAIGGVIGGLLESAGLREKQPEGLEKILLALEEKINTDELSKDDDVKAAQKEQLLSYLKAYYAIQTAQFKLDSAANQAGSLPFEILEGAVESVKELGSRILGKLFGKEEEETDTLTQKYNAIISKLDENINVESFVNNDEVEDAQFEAMKTFITTYYSAQSIGTSASVITEKAGSSIGNFFGGIAKGVADSLAGNEDLGVYTDIITELNKNITLSKVLTADTEDKISKAQMDSTIEFLVSYYEAQSNELINSQTDKESFFGKISSSIRNNIVGWYEGLFGNDSLTPFQQAVIDIVNAPDSYKLSDDKLSQLESIKAVNVITAVEGILKKESEALVDTYESSMSRSKFKKSSLASFTDSYIDSVSKALKSSSDISSNSLDTGESISAVTYDDTRLLNQLNNIAAQLNTLIVTLQESVIGNVVVSSTTVTQDNNF